MSIIYSSKPLRPRERNDFYPTPRELCRAAIGLLPEDFNPRFILDPGAGTGIWGEEIKKRFPDSGLLGVEIRDVEKNRVYNLWARDDYRNAIPTAKYNLIMGNPPFRYAGEFLDVSFTLLDGGGYILFLLPLSFLESDTRYKKYYSRNIKPKYVYVSTRRVSFTGDRKGDNTAYAIYIWQKEFTGDTTLRWLHWSYDEPNPNS